MDLKNELPGISKYCMNPTPIPSRSINENHFKNLFKLIVFEKKRAMKNTKIKNLVIYCNASFGKLNEASLIIGLNTAENTTSIIISVHITIKYFPTTGI